jgi:outer membrane protein assembly factor BamB
LGGLGLRIILIVALILGARRLATRVVWVCVIATATLAGQTETPLWNQWRGAARDGVATFAAPATWPQQLTRRWEVTVGVGHSSPVVAGDRVIVHTRQADREVVTAFDLASGKQIWQGGYAAPYTINPAARAHGPGPKSTPVVASGRVFTLGISGVLAAHDVATGKLAWRTEASASLPQYGTAMSPVVEGDMVIAHLGGDDAGAITAFDTATGKVVWRATGAGPAYASPVVATVAGTRQVITQTKTELLGLEVASGRRLWAVPFRTSYDQSSVTPLVVGDVVIYSGLESPTIALRVTRKGTTFTTEPIWRNEQVSMYMSSPAVDERTVFGLSHRNRGQFFALDLATGKTLWTTRGREGDNASIVRAGALLLLFTTNAEMIVARATAGRWDEVKRYSIADSAVWAHPAVIGNRILVKDVDKLILWTL